MFPLSNKEVTLFLIGLCTLPIWIYLGKYEHSIWVEITLFVGIIVLTAILLSHKGLLDDFTYKLLYQLGAIDGSTYNWFENLFGGTNARHVVSVL